MNGDDERDEGEVEQDDEDGDDNMNELLFPGGGSKRTRGSKHHSFGNGVPSPSIGQGGSRNFAWNPRRWSWQAIQ
jgi:hypothetical protein